MRNALMFMLLSALTLNFLTGTSVPTTINGSAALYKGTYTALNINGSLTFEDLDVTETLEVNGSIKGKNLTCAILQGNGSVKIEGLKADRIEIKGAFHGDNIHVKESAQLGGEVTINHSLLQQVDVLTTHATFENTQVKGNIRMQKSTQGWVIFGFRLTTSAPQVLELKGDSQVSGDIVFDEAGEVHVFDHAKIQGNVINATVVHK
jgi:cytoskeletal protein CcmA (bactofilin family)